MPMVKLNDLLKEEAAEVVIYKTAGNMQLRMLVQKPEGWQPADSRTAIIWIHGGAWCSGAPESFLPHCRYFTARGAVNFSIQYRLTNNPDLPQPSSNSDSTLADCVEDCKSAIQHIRQQAGVLGIDPDRIVVAGDSAGGHLALCLAVQADFSVPNENPEVSSLPNAVINCNGIVDLTGKWKKHVPDHLTRSVSPIFNIKKGQPPMLIMHGLKDAVVEPADAVRFFNAYREAGNQAELILWPTARHAFICFRYTASDTEILQAMQATDSFLVSLGFLQGSPTLEL